MTTANTLAALVNSSSQVVVPSGGVNFGTDTDGTGTFTGGVLDDYEEGTWTPATAGDATAVIADNYGHYVKIGAVVHLHGRFSVSTSFTNAVFDGLPFTINHLVSTSGSSNQSLGLVKSDVGGTTGIYVLAVNGTSEFNTRLVAGDGSYALVGGKQYRFTITYFTNN
jgi:hypothetical protein